MSMAIFVLQKQEMQQVFDLTFTVVFQFLSVCFQLFAGKNPPLHPKVISAFFNEFFSYLRSLTHLLI